MHWRRERVPTAALAHGWTALRGQGWSGLRAHGWTALSLATLAVVLRVTWAYNDRFMFSGDKQAQYLPVMRDIGHRLGAGEFPTIDPNLGTSGNFAMDVQYGLYDPTQLLTSVLLNRAEDLVRVSWLWSTVLLGILCGGTCILLRRLGVAGAWAAAGGLSVATAGYTFYWLAPSWMPALTGLAWLPWWWCAWHSRRPDPWSLLGLGIFAYLVVASGWPFTWLAFGAIGLGSLLEDTMRKRAGVALRTLSSLAGTAAGAAVAVPLMMSVDYTLRSTSVSDNGGGVINLAEILDIASPVLGNEIGRLTTHNFDGPLTLVAWFLVVLVWGVAWSRRTFASPGVIGAGFAALVCLAMTQMPTVWGPFRLGLRNLEGFQLSLVVFVLAAYAATPAVWSRLRMVGVVATLIGCGYIAWARFPDTPGVLGGGLLVLAFGVLLMAVLATPRRVLAPVADGWLKPAAPRPRARSPRIPRRQTIAGLVALVTTAVVTGCAVQHHANPQGVDHGVPAGGVETPTAIEPGVPTLYLFQPAVAEQEATRLRDGLGWGFAALSPDRRILNGYSSIGQTYLNHQLCIGWQGDSCPRIVRRLFDVEPTTGRSYADLLGVQQIVAIPKFAAKVRKFAPPPWHLAARLDTVSVFRRQAAPQIGRITDIVGEATARPVHITHEQQTYDVSTKTGARLVFRDVYWPGYTASLDGEALSVEPVAQEFVSVELPPGSSGELTVRFEPPGAGLRLALWLVGGVGLACCLAVPLLTRIRRATPSSASTPPAVEGRDH
jgi:hypothetical protein